MISESELIGEKVRHKSSRMTGVIVAIRNGFVFVDFNDKIMKFEYPGAFGSNLELQNNLLQANAETAGRDADFNAFVNVCKHDLDTEVNYLKRNGGKKYQAIDGLLVSKKNGHYMYTFDTDTELHFPDGTLIKIKTEEGYIPAYVNSCEDFTIIFDTDRYLGDTPKIIEFTTNQWGLIEELVYRLGEIDPQRNRIAYDIATKGRSQISYANSIRKGQSTAIAKATSEPITFIWGPPGTGKTTTLAKIALEHIFEGKRVLMLSYSNVSVDGALLKVAEKATMEPGTIIRYGYPRTEKLIDNEELTSYRFAVKQNPELNTEYSELRKKYKKIKSDKSRTEEKVEIKNQLNAIRAQIKEKEIELLHKASFVATTVSKATVDRNIYGQQFDVVIFDEASIN